MINLYHRRTKLSLTTKSQLLYKGFISLFITLGSVSCLYASSFVAFESGQVRPLALSINKDRLFAVNTPDNRLEIFDIKADGLILVESVPVGLEPVAVAARDNGEIWVVNHLSDSISIIDTTVTPARIIRTLLVGDEPRDIVFAGTGNNRAFVTVAHRGQNGPYNDPINPGEMTSPGVGRADVWVFDVNNTGSSLTGDPLTIINLFGDTPRALTVSPDGSTVYAAVFHSGNKTTAISGFAVCDGGQAAPPCAPVVGELQAPGGLPDPDINIENLLRPEVGLIVKNNGTNWVDELDRNWDNMVRFNLPDLDVFAINANANPPVQSNSFASVGTILYNMAVNPVSGKVYVSNTDAFNEVRFEGSRPPLSTISTVQGHQHETRITVIDPTTGNVVPRHLNKHIDYNSSPAASGVSDNSLALPRAMTVSADGKNLFLAAKGSNKLAVFDTAKLEDNSFVPNSATHIALSGGGPSGLVLNENNGQLFVLTRFDNGISIVNTNTMAETSHYQLHNPEPQQIIEGRPFLYDANLTSSNGEAACGSCHVDGDFDSLAWDLGDPEGTLLNNPSPFLGAFPAVDNPPAFYKNFHPMKGPMTTQTLRGMAGQGPMHWRGDRTGGNDEVNVQPDSGTFNEDLSFKKFNPAFVGLLGRSVQLTDLEMQKFTDFTLQITMPPNPVRALDNGLTTSQQAAHGIYFTAETDGVDTTCNSCHVLDVAAGFFGTDGSSSFEAESQHFKIPQLRNMYTKVGMFGMPDVPFHLSGDNQHMGDQIRGFGFMHDGSVDTLLRFVSAAAFTFPGITSAEQDQQRKDMEQLMLAFDSNLKPVVGQQATLTASNQAVVNPRIDLFIAQAALGHCDLIVKSKIGNETRGWMRLTNASFKSDKIAETDLTDTQLRALINTAGQALTYTCVPPEPNQAVALRMALDRDEDGILDGNDICPAISNVNQLDDDSDNIGNLCDNCIAVSNTNQRDSNGDGFGNSCDADLNNDGVTNFPDLAILRSSFGGSDPDADLNGDGFVNFPDLATFRSAFGKPPGPSAMTP